MTDPIEQPTDPHPESAARRVPWRAAGIVALAVAIVVLGGWSIGAFAAEDAPGPLVPRAEPVLPDLAMGPIEDIAAGTTPTGEQRLRFAATIVNIGDGPFLVRASRSFIASDAWTVDQWIAERSGGFSASTTRAGLIFGGDGHDHWHVRQVEVHQLETPDGEILGRLVKQGFCFFDTDVYDGSIDGSPELAHWGARGCASSFDTRVRMGLSIGWGDKYPWHLVDERIDVTDVPDGIYRLREIADPNDEFEESDETNNETWVDIELSTTADGIRDAQVVRDGPAPEGH
ncbi:MAG: hypothetical protein H0T59_06820 [Chloroflexi bacterium]|nr:hypothetical protein [Chloroflexota bacterium]